MQTEEQKREKARLRKQKQRNVTLNDVTPENVTLLKDENVTPAEKYRKALQGHKLSAPLGEEYTKGLTNEELVVIMEEEIRDRNRMRPWFPEGRPTEVPPEAWDLLKPWTIKQIRDIIPIRESMSIDESQRWPRAIAYHKLRLTRFA